MGKTWKDSKFFKAGNARKKTEERHREHYVRHSKYADLEIRGYQLT